jgi:8-oxo-dGTP pyrophosphatase MutT (NUDIX family)
MNTRKRRFTFRSAVYLILLDGNKILLSRRFNTGWMDGKYSLISGHIDGNESVSQAMIREAQEEVSIKVAKKNLIPAVALHRKSGREYIEFFFIAKRWIGIPKIMETDRCDSLKWFFINKLPKNVLPHVRLAVENYKKHIPFFEFGW